jgi:hypothetical protein
MKRFLIRTLFHPRRKPRLASLHRSRLRAEQLEPRAMLSVNAWQDDVTGLLVVVADDIRTSDGLRQAAPDDAFMMQVATVPQSLLIANNSSFRHDPSNNLTAISISDVNNTVSGIYVTQGVATRLSAELFAGAPFNLGSRHSDGNDYGPFPQNTSTHLLRYNGGTANFGDPPLFEGTVTNGLGDFWDFTWVGGGPHPLSTPQTGAGTFVFTPVGSPDPANPAPVYGYPHHWVGFYGARNGGGQTSIAITWSTAVNGLAPEVTTVRYGSDNLGSGVGATAYAQTKLPASAGPEPVFQLPPRPAGGGYVLPSIQGVIRSQYLDEIPFRVDANPFTGLSDVTGVAYPPTAPIPLVLSPGATDPFSITVTSPLLARTRTITGFLDPVTDQISLRFVTNYASQGGNVNYAGSSGAFLQDIGSVSLDISYVAYQGGGGAPSRFIIAPGLDISRPMAIDLPAPGSTVEINSPLIVGGAARTSIAATNISVNAQLTAGSRLDIRSPSTQTATAESVTFNAATLASAYDIRLSDDPGTTGVDRGRLFVSPTGSLTGAGSVFVQADIADIVVEGEIDAAFQTYLMRSPVTAQDRAPFLFTTRSPATGADTGLISGTTIGITLANDLETPDTGGAAANEVSLRTDVTSLRVTAANRGGPTAAFPYELTIDEIGDLAIDAVPASSGPISIAAGGSITLNSALSTDGDLAITAGGNFVVSAPLTTTRGRLVVEASNLTIRNSLRVLAPRVDPLVDDIVLTASAGDLNLTGAISAVNNVRLVQRNDGATPTAGRISGPTRVVGRGVTIDADGAVDVRTNADFFRGGAGGNVTVDELDDITIPDLRAGGFVTLRAGGVDPGLGNIISPNAIALTATLQDVTGLSVSAPNGSISVTTNTDRTVALGNAAAIAAGTAQNMEAGGSVLVRSIAGPLSIADAPIGGGGGVPVRIATTAPLNGTFAYNQPGVRASTLTASAVGPLVVDGVNLRVGDRVLVRDQFDPRENGIYDVTVAGSNGPPGRAWVLTRTIALDTTAELPANTMVRVLEGSVAGRNFQIGYTTTFGSSPLIATQVTNRSGAARVRVATTAMLPGTYTSSSPGILGTISAPGALPAIDGIQLVPGDRVLVRQGAQNLPAGLPASTANGVYEVTAVGSPVGAWILTRAIDVDTGQPVEIGYVTVDQGTFRAATTGMCFRLGYDSLGIDPLTVTAVGTANGRPVTNIGSDDSSDIATFIVSSTAGTNDAAGSLGKMIRLRQQNDPSASRNPDQKTDFRFSALIDRPILLTQELPVITKPFPLDGDPTLRFRPVGVSLPVTLPPIVVNGLSINQTLANTGVFRGTSTATVSGPDQLTVPGTFPNFGELRPGMAVSGPGIRPGSRILSLQDAGRLVWLTDPIELAIGASVAVSFVTEVNGIQFAPGSTGGRLANLFIGGFDNGSAVRVTAPAGVPAAPGSTPATIAIDQVTIGQLPTGGRLGNEFGVLVAGSGSARITGGEITSSTGAAIRTQDQATGVTVTGTTIGRVGNPNAMGIDVGGSGTVDIGSLPVDPAPTSPRTTIAFNRVGVALRDGTTRIVNTTITDSTFDGIEIAGGSYQIGSGTTRDAASNVIVRNGGWGIDIAAAAAPTNPQVDGRRIQGNFLGVQQDGVAAANTLGNVRVAGPTPADRLGFRPRSSNIDDHGNLHAPLEVRPTAHVAVPLDNSANDLNTIDNQVRVEGAAARITALALRLEDDADAINAATVRTAAFTVRYSPSLNVTDWNGPDVVTWRAATDYGFRYDSAGRQVWFDVAAGLPSGSYRISVDNSATTGVRDVDNNPLLANDVAGPGTTAFVVVLNAGPRADISANPTTLGPGQTATITFVLTEDSNDFALDDVVTTGGSLSNFAGSGRLYTATLTPPLNSTVPGTIVVPADRFTSGGVGNPASALASPITINTVTLPEVSIGSDVAVVYRGQTAQITFTLSESATDFGPDDVTVGGGQLSDFVGSGTLYSATFTPTVDSTTPGTITVAAGRFTSPFGQPNLAGSLVPSIVVNTGPQAAVITVSPATLIAGQTATVTFQLTAPSADFTAADVTVTGGTLSGLTGSGASYSGTFTPDLNSTTPGSIAVAAGTFTGPTGNSNIGSALSPPIQIDTVGAAVAITSSVGSLRTGQTALITFTLAQPVTDFTVDDVFVTGGTLSSFAGSGTVYTATFTPAPNSTANGTISVPAGQVTYPAGNLNRPGALSPPLSIDTVSPAVTIASNRTTLRSGQTAQITFTLSEPSTNFTIADVTVTGGTASGFTGNGTNYTATFTPSPNFTGNGTVIVAAGAFTDSFGNGNASGSLAIPISIDTVAPRVTIATDRFALRAGQTATITFTLSEPATDFAAADVAVTGGTLSDFTGSGVLYTAVFTPVPSPAGSGAVSVAANAFTDPAGNGNVAGMLTPAISIDTVAPTVSIGTSTLSLASGQTTTISFTLSEPATNFTAADITVTGGTLSGFTGSGTSYSAIFRPDVNSMANGTVEVAADTFTDARGNGNVAGSLSPSITIDTVSPTITAFIAAAGTYGIGDRIEITAALSELVRGGGRVVVGLNTGASVILSAVANTATAAGTYLVDVGQRADQLRVTSVTSDAALPILDLAGNPLVTTSLPANGDNFGSGSSVVVDGSIAVLTNGPFSTNPNQVTNVGVSVTQVPVRFTAPVTGVTLAAFELLLDGRPVSLRDAQLSGSGASYTLTLPALRANPSGIYTLVVRSDTGIRSVANNAPLAAPGRIYWGKDRSVSSTTIESAGSVRLSYDAAGSLAANDTVIRFNGGPANYQQLVAAGWTPVAAEVDGGRNTVILKHASGNLHFWRLDANWQVVSSDGWVIPGTPAFSATEVAYGVDLDGDGVIGVSLTPIEQAGSVTLATDGGGNLRANDTLVRFNGGPANYQQLVAAGWTPVAAEVDGGTNTVILKHASGNLHFWRLDSNWQVVSSDGWVIPGTPAFSATEVAYGVDLDGDGVIGVNLTPIEQAGSVTLATDGGGNLRANGTLVRFNGSPANYQQLVAAGWTPVAADVDGGVNTVILRHTSGNLHFWRLDANWQVVSSDGWVIPGTSEFFATELAYGVDLDGDGVVTIEAAGSVRLAIDADGNLRANSTVVRFNGGPANYRQLVAAGWTPVAAEVDGITNTVILEHTSGNLHFWRLDAGWQVLSGDGWVAPGTSEFLATELAFGVDLDRNLRIGF